MKRMCLYFTWIKESYRKCNNNNNNIFRTHCLVLPLGTGPGGMWRIAPRAPLPPARCKLRQDHRENICGDVKTKGQDRKKNMVFK